MNNATTQYPEINTMNLADCNAALNLADLNAKNIRPEFHAEFTARVAAIQERKRRLEWTAKRNAKIDAALRRSR